MVRDDIISKLAMQNTCATSSEEGGCTHTYCGLILQARGVLGREIPEERRDRIVAMAERVVDQYDARADDATLRDYVKGLKAAVEGQRWK